MPDARPIVTLLTDFGDADYYVAAVKGVLLQLAPEVTLVDVGHQVTPGDVEGAAFLVAAAARWYPAGSIHLAVVDPGVGGERRILVARCDERWYVAPDNGLLTPILDDADEVREVDADDIFLTGPGSTFHGRDRFAPVAAYLARGEDPAALGQEIDDEIWLELPEPQRDGNRLYGRVAHVDRFGNLVTDLPSDWLDDGCVVDVDGHATDRVVSHYEQLPPGEAGVVPGSLGTLELSLDGASLADLWQVGRGARVVVRPRDGGAATGRGSNHEKREPQEGVRAMTQWEYKVVNIRSENYRLDPNCSTELNRLGDDGWELVGLTSVNFKSGATDNIAMVFKRPVD